MTLFDILFFNRELIDRLEAAGVRPGDTRFIDLFIRFNQMVAAGHKVSYVVAALASQFSVSERKVYQIIRRFRADFHFR